MTGLNRGPIFCSGKCVRLMGVVSSVLDAMLSVRTSVCNPIIVDILELFGNYFLL